MRGKLIEDLLYQKLVEPAERTANSTLYNGAAAGSATAIDTEGFDELNVVVNAGTFEGAASVASALYEYASNAAASATAITGADFTAITTSNDNAAQVGAVRTASTKRYVWLRTVQTGSATSRFSAVAILGKDVVNPQSNSAVFDLDLIT
jgi:hypothetical protein